MTLIGAVPDTNGATSNPLPGSDVVDPGFNSIPSSQTAAVYGPTLANQMAQQAITAFQGAGSPGGAASVQSLLPSFAQAPEPAAPTPQTPSGGNNLGLINTYPGVANALALQQMGIAQDDASLNSARQRAIIQFGDPALAGMAGFGLDPQAGAFAQQNYLSGNATLSRLDRAHQQAAQAIINQLAAHGLLNSGDLGYREGQENQGYGNNVYDAQQSVLGQLANLYSNYLNHRGALGDAVTNAQMAALQAFMSNPDAYASLLGGGSPNSNSTTAPPSLPKLSPPKPVKTSAARAVTKALGGGRTAMA